MKNILIAVAIAVFVNIIAMIIYEKYLNKKTTINKPVQPITKSKLSSSINLGDMSGIKYTL